MFNVVLFVTESDPEKETPQPIGETQPHVWPLLYHLTLRALIYLFDVWSWTFVGEQQVSTVRILFSEDTSSKHKTVVKAFTKFLKEVGRGTVEIQDSYSSDYISWVADTMADTEGRYHGIIVVSQSMKNKAIAVFNNQSLNLEEQSDSFTSECERMKNLDLDYDRDPNIQDLFERFSTCTSLVKFPDAPDLTGLPPMLKKRNVYNLMDDIELKGLLVKILGKNRHMEAPTFKHFHSWKDLEAAVKDLEPSADTPGTNKIYNEPTLTPDGCPEGERTNGPVRTVSSVVDSITSDTCPQLRWKLWNVQCTTRALFHTSTGFGQRYDSQCSVVRKVSSKWIGFCLCCSHDTSAGSCATSSDVSSLPPKTCTGWWYLSSWTMTL